MAPLLLLLFVGGPILELWVILQVGNLIGAGWTIVALIVISVLGTLLVRREGTRAWAAFRTALAETRMPAVEVVDGALVLLAGALLVTPGFVTDGIGMLLLFPLTRSGINRMVRSRVRLSFGLGPAPGDDATRRDRTRRQGDAVDVEVVEIRREDPDERPPPPGLDPPR